MLHAAARGSCTWIGCGAGGGHGERAMGRKIDSPPMHCSLRCGDANGTIMILAERKAFNSSSDTMSEYVWIENPRRPTAG